MRDTIIGSATVTRRFGKVGANRFDLEDSVVVCHAHVDELGNELLGRRLSHQKPHLLKGVGGPREQDEESNENGTNGVQIPDEFIADDSHDQAEDVDDDIVAVVHEKDVDRRKPAVKEAIHHQGALEEDWGPVSPARKTAGGNQGLTSNAHKHQRDDLELLRVSGPAAQVSTRLNLEGLSALLHLSRAAADLLKAGRPRSSSRRRTR